MAKLVDATDLKQIECSRRETMGVEPLKFGETSQVAIPSQARRLTRREGVETRRAAPKAETAQAVGEGEGIVQTPNLLQGGESRSGYENP